jgi:hypothetical protein
MRKADIMKRIFLGLIGLLSLLSGRAVAATCSVSGDDLRRLADVSADDLRRDPFENKKAWKEAPRTVDPTLLRPSGDLAPRAAAVQNFKKCAAGTGEWKRAALPGKDGAAVFWQSRGCNGEEGAEFDGPWLATGAAGGSDRFKLDFNATSISGLFCGEGFVVVVQESPPGQPYSANAVELFIWDLPSGKNAGMHSYYYSEGPTFKPIDLRRNIGGRALAKKTKRSEQWKEPPAVQFEVRSSRRLGLVVVSGPKGSIAIDPAKFEYWGIDLKSGKPRAVEPSGPPE